MNDRHIFKIIPIFAAILLSQLSTPISLCAEDTEQGWKIIGNKIINDKMARAPIKIGPEKGEFNQLRIQAMRAPLKVDRMIIQFMDGERQVVQLGYKINKGMTSKIVRFKSGTQAVDKVILWYQKGSSEGKKPTISVWGRIKSTE